MSEKKVQNEIVKYLKSLHNIHILDTYKMGNGEADIVCCYKGRFISIEVKKKHIHTENQKINKLRVENAGGIYLLAYLVRDVEEVIKKVEKDGKQYRNKCTLII